METKSYYILIFSFFFFVTSVNVSFIVKKYRKRQMSLKTSKSLKVFVKVR